MKLDHVGIAVHNLEAGVELYTSGYGGRLVHREELAAEGVRLAFIDAGGVLLELLEPTAHDGPLAGFLRSRGEGLHHLAFAVPDVARALAEAASAGRPPIDAQPRRGSRGRLIAFLHPTGSHGVLIELVQGAV